MANSTIQSLAKPQQVYGIAVCNDRTAVYVPAVHPDKPFSIVPLDLTPQPGHGYDTRFGDLKTKQNFTDRDFEAPEEHFPHPYEAEIRKFAYTKEQLDCPSSVAAIEAQESLAAEWVDDVDGLKSLVSALEEASVVAVDLEAHSHRSFAGIVCLMQMSVRTDNGISDFLIDTLKLRSSVNAHLAPIFANPSIVKVMHGADYDVQWLQRDFGIYVVNLFDTGRAARALGFSSAGYAYLLKRYVDIVADKSHQLADWRQRPLPDEMLQYAAQDTHYLLDIYKNIKADISKHKETTVESILDISRKVCLIRYTPEPFDRDGYRKLLRVRGRSSTELTSRQKSVLKALWDWRDKTARRHDESLAFVCTNSQLLRLALAASSSFSANRLQALFHPIPPLVLEHSTEILDCMLQNEEPSDTFFKPAVTERHRDLMSPVLGTEALYTIAGWMTPMPSDVGVEDVGDDDFDEEEEEEEVREALNSSLERARSLDGCSLATETNSVDFDRSLNVSSQVQDTSDSRKTAIPTILNLVANSKSGSNPTDHKAEAKSDAASEAQDEADIEFVIPKSIREIYMISNRNRRNKKTTSPTTEEKPLVDADELEKAEEILQMHGQAVAGYFDSLSVPISKRARTKSESGRESAESVPENSKDKNASSNPVMPSKEDDLSFMKEIGWLNQGEDMPSLLGRDLKEPPSNPFFAGSALLGGALHGNKQGLARKNTDKQPKAKQNRKEKPEKRDGRTFAYRKR